jgi:hypothetical protein
MDLTPNIGHSLQATLRPHKNLPFDLLWNFENFKLLHIFPLFIIEAFYHLEFGYLQI